MISVEASIRVPLSKVWNMWTEPQHIVNWNFASDDWHCPSAENDLRPGGTFNYVMAAKDGAMSFNFEGIYPDVQHLKKIDFALSDGRKVHVEFFEQGSDTNIRESFEPETQNPRDLQEAGWRAILNNFKKLVEES